ncbi:MAG: GAF domain-containing protein [Flavobacteriaceae bacterium]|jgi:GAF domain-containing protein|nr:GAF domain-containing protein [Flavobacteriaceae bacterium]
MNYVATIDRCKLILERIDLTREEKLQEICELLYDSISYYDWVGYYFADHEKKILTLGPYIGEHTDHTSIPFGKGICGQVALSNDIFLVEDVQKQENYLSCSINVKSEIVVPLFVEGVNIGQIDIDSHTINAFDSRDIELLTNVNKEVAKLF